MSKRDDVIRGLKCGVCPTMSCSNCTYFVPNENDPDTGWCDRNAIYRDALELLEDPDLVKPIRCKDCLMWRAPTHEDIEDGITTGFCNNAGFGTESFDFCSGAIMR